MSTQQLASQLFTDSMHDPNKPSNDPSPVTDAPVDGRQLVDIVRIIDGDTIVVRFEDGTEETIRMLLIDTPETGDLETGSQLYADEATMKVRQLLGTGRAQVAYDVEAGRDDYGRLLMNVYDELGNSVQERLLYEGLARVAYVFEPNTTHLNDYRAVEQAAKLEQKGIWSVPNYATPTGFDNDAVLTPAGVAESYTDALVEPTYDSITVDDTKAFTSEAKKLGAKIEFKKSRFGNSSYTSFSGTDITIAISFKGGVPVPVGEAQTVSYSLFRPMEPVYALGSAKPHGFVRGPRTIAGSVIFTVFDRNVLLDKFYSAYEKVDAEATDRAYLTDELPPFDIHALFMNEYGMSASLVIHGVHVASEGQVMSIEDMITENTMQYVATDLSLMRPERI